MKTNMAATARISNNRRAAAQLQLSAKSGITGGTSTDSASSDQVLLHNLHTVRGISYCRFREHAFNGNSTTVSNSRRGLSWTLHIQARAYSGLVGNCKRRVLPFLQTRPIQIFPTHKNILYSITKQVTYTYIKTEIK
jgi:hypothetical protein